MRHLMTIFGVRRIWALVKSTTYSYRPVDVLFGHMGDPVQAAADALEREVGLVMALQLLEIDGADTSHLLQLTSMQIADHQRGFRQSPDMQQTTPSNVSELPWTTTPKGSVRSNAYESPTLGRRRSARLRASRSGYSTDARHEID